MINPTAQCDSPLSDQDVALVRRSGASLRSRILTRARRRLALWLLPGLALAAGCSAPVAAGCAAGTLTGVLMGLVSFAAASGQDGASVDGGQLALGGAIIGLATGCTAARVTDLMHDDKSSRHGEQRYHDRTMSRRERAEDARLQRLVRPPLGRSAQISSHASLDGVTVTWLGLPKGDASRAAIRFEASPQVLDLESCTHADVYFDGNGLRFLLQHSQPVAETTQPRRAQFVTDTAFIGLLERATDVNFVFCGTTRRLSSAGRSAMSRFMSQFHAVAGVAAPAPALPVVGEPEAPNPVTAEPGEQLPAAATTMAAGTEQPRAEPEPEPEAP